MRNAAWKVFIRVNFSSKCASWIYYTLYKEVQQICICHDLEFGKWEVVFGVWDLVFRVDKEVRSLREHSTSLVEEHTNVPRHTIAIFTNCIRAQLHRYCTTVAPACTICTAKHHSANYNKICRAGGWGFVQTCWFLLLLLHLHLDHRSYQHLMSRHSLGGALIKGYGAPGRLGQLATFPWQVIHLWKWKWNMFFSSKSICGCEMFWQVNSPSLYCPCQMIVLIDRHHSKFSFTTVLIEFVRHCPQYQT